MSQGANAAVNISSLIVGALPHQASAVRAGLESMAGVEVHAVGADGQFVVTIETGSDDSTVQTFESIRLMPGVLSAAMVYHQYETDPDEEA